jgi:hypothetical protein
MPNNTFRNSEDKRFDETFDTTKTVGSNHFSISTGMELKSFLHDSQRRLVEKLVGELRIIRDEKYPIENISTAYARIHIPLVERIIALINQTLM